MLSTTQVLLASVFVAETCHFVWKRKEPDARFVLAFMALAQILLPALFVYKSHLNIYESIRLTVLATSVWIFTIFTSIAIYRLSPWHPLAGIPGPKRAKLTKWWSSWQVIKRNRYLSTHALHQKYGDIVRIGPNEISFNLPSVVNQIYVDTNWYRGPYYRGVGQVEYANLVSEHDPANHAWRRQLWLHAFTTSSVQQYMQPLRIRVNQLLDILTKRCQGGKPVDYHAFASYFAMDFMSDMAFGAGEVGMGGFDLMNHGSDHENKWATLLDGMFVFSTMGCVAWMRPILEWLPDSLNDFSKLQKWAAQQSIKRQAKKPGHDIFYFLLDEEGRSKHKYTQGNLAEDALLCISAGSDTTAVTLTNIMLHVGFMPEIWDTLQKEIDSTFDLEEEMDFSTLARLPYLNAVCEEALRYMPPVPQIQQRIVGPTDAVIAGHHIPKDTCVGIPCYTMQHDPRYFKDPEKFIPERWMPNSTIRPHNKAAFTPFAVGNHACAGKNLAYAELKLVTASLVRAFDVQTPKDFDRKAWMAGLKEQFITSQPALPVIFTPRTAHHRKQGI